jgi:NADPH-dependent F420 reductase
VRAAVLGGSGRFGSALALRLADAGWDVVVGSRDARRAVEAAGQLGAAVSSGAAVQGALLRDAVRDAEVVVVAVPDAGHGPVLREVAGLLRGRVVLDCCVCRDPGDAGRWRRPREGSAALRARRLAPRGAAVAAALHTVPETALRYPDRHPPGDCLVAADGPAALEAAALVASALGLRWWEAGDLGVAAALEQLACMLSRLGARGGASAPGLRLHGLGPGGRP